jgi:hypothetical protein
VDLEDQVGIDATSSQPLTENVKELGSGSMVQSEHAGTVNMRVQHNLTIDLGYPEVAEPPTAVNLASGGNGPVVCTHDNLNL